MSIIKHVTLQKIVAHDFRYNPRILYPTRDTRFKNFTTTQGPFKSLDSSVSQLVAKLWAGLSYTAIRLPLRLTRPMGMLHTLFHEGYS